MVQMQQQQAAQAELSNADLQARLTQGVKEINQQFQGTPTGSTKLDLSSIASASPYTGALPSANTAPVFAPPAPPSSAAAASMYGGIDPYTGAPTPSADQQARLQALMTGTPYVPSAVDNTDQGTPVNTDQQARIQALTTGTPYVPGTMGMTQGSGYGGQLANGYTWGVLGDTGGGSPTYGIFDPSGNLVTNATNLSDLSKASIYVGGDPSKTTGGFGSDFYNTYQNSILGYYMPQEDMQYNNARTTLNYNLARAGQLNSSTAGKDIADLANQDVMNRANITSQADQQTGALRTTVAQNQQSALNQLYSTENPSVAANTAENMVANAQLTKPILNPVGQLFNVASVGVGNALTGFTNPYAYINSAAGGAGGAMGAMTTPGAATTGSGSGGSGLNVPG